ncbi:MULTISPECIES: restriction endonuclease subunit S [Leuconostoc]|uniref:restriction endonuclease subunit S n=1 Tax=Leuconostoc TaxID=1243 RepID=UPI0009FB9708|nr:restriction endonuclease subunit S [Leuconostoc sp. BM2]QQB01124.1 restriction endonuclease subunit S [Leuconostoc pseudomesenteroides]
MQTKKRKSPSLRFRGYTDDWEERKIEDILKNIKGSMKIGPFGSALKKEYYVEKGIKVYAQENIFKNDFSLGNYYITEDKYLELQSCELIPGDIVISMMGTIGACSVFPETSEKGIMNSHLLRLQTNDSSLAEYIALQIKDSPFIKQQILKLSVGSIMSGLSSTVVKKLKFPIPSIEEQRKIYLFFKQLDDTITLHQRKLDLLKEQKKGFLQKMFPKNGSRVPEMRFSGFADDWEERKLSSISERVTRKNKNNESTLPLTISAQDGLVDQNDFFNKQVASRDVTGYLLVKNGEFAYNKSYSNGYPWGAIKRLDKYDMGVLSTLYIVFRPTKINSQFLVSYYDTTRWYREVSKNAAEGARNHGLLNIAPTDFFNTLLVVPKIVDEQEKIGSFFKQMDNTIALHQRKLDLLKEQKKGFLQKMFV